MNAPRVQRIQKQLLRETTAILQELKDPRIGFVTVTRTEITADVRHAKIFVSILGSAGEQDETFGVLSRASGFVRTQVGKRMRLRYTPEIQFVKDESGGYVDRVLKILDEIKKDDEEKMRRR